MLGANIPKQTTILQPTVSVMDFLGSLPPTFYFEKFQTTEKLQD